MADSNTEQKHDFDAPIEALKQLIAESSDQLETGSDEIREQFYSDYNEIVEQIVMIALDQGLTDFATLCFAAGEITAAMEAGEIEIDETQIDSLCEFPKFLETVIETGFQKLDVIEEFLQCRGWDTSLKEDVDEIEDGDDVVGMSDITEDNTATTLEETTPKVGQKLDKMQQEVVDLLRAELAEIIEAHQENLARLTDTDSNLRNQQLEQLTDQLERISNACEMIGLEGLSTVATQIAENFADMDLATEPMTEKWQALFHEWPIYVLRYFQESFSQKSSALIIQLLKRPDWPLPLSNDEGETFLSLLCDAKVSVEGEDVAPRQVKAIIEDLSLEIPGEVNQELLNSLLEELPDQTANFSSSVQSMIKNHFVSDIELARRVAHTIKGSCNTVGIIGLANMTHQLEDILDELALNNVVPTGELANTFLDAADCMESMVESVLGLADEPDEALMVQQSILDWANHIDQEGVANITIAAAAPGASTTLEADTSAPEIADESPESPTETTNDAVLRIRSSLVDELLRQAGENIISTGQIQSHLGIAQESMRKLNLQNQYLNHLVSELEQLVDVRGIASRHDRDNDSELDALELEHYNELHTSTHRLIEAVIDNIEFASTVTRDLKSLEDVAEVQEKLVRDSQESVLKTRMVPVSTTVPRLQRCVRQAMRATNSQVRLEVRGSETLIDSNVLNDLMEPLMHLLRNAVDHGIESAEERTQSGKDVEGCINLSFAREGDHISVNIKDDGRGLDKGAILARAEEKGMLNPGQTPAAEDINNYILTPGFSTRSEVTQMSGRGVGLDVVNQKVRDAKGTLIISSEAGRGTNMSISLPVTLISTHAMLIPVQEQLYAVSNFGVEEIIYANEGDIDYLGDKLVFKTGSDLVAAHFLNEKLGVSGMDSAFEDAQVGLLVRQQDGTRRVLLVERVIDSRDLVVKPLSQQIPNVDGIVGATILGDGSVAPVLDLTELLLSNSTSHYIGGESSTLSQNNVPSNLPSAIVVDDSYSARNNLEEFVTDLGFEVRAAKDGMEAVEMMLERVPDILLTDLEMPRMNGLDLATHVRSNEETNHLPIILITSRSTQKHRELAVTAGINEYMTKPYSEDELMHNIESLLAL